MNHEEGLNKHVYELYLSFASSACESYRKDTILNPFPIDFVLSDLKRFGIFLTLKLKIIRSFRKMYKYYFQILFK
jgi:hypothetical protein